MSEKELRTKVGSMIADLLIKIETTVPEEGSFPTVYSEFKNTDNGMCLTDVMLRIQSIPDYLPNYETDRWLELTGYRLPIPYKSTMIIFKGKKKEILNYLKRSEALDKILHTIPKLDDNLRDI